MYLRKLKLSYLFYAILGSYYLLAIIYLRPGFFLGDSAFEYHESLTHAYYDWHPPMMNLWWSLFHNNASAPFIAHLSLFCLGVYFFVSTFLKDQQPVRATIIFFILMNPVTSFSLFNVLKDTGMLASLVFLTAILYKYYRGQLSFRLAISLTIPLFIYAFCIRQNAVFAVFPLLIFISLHHHDRLSFVEITRACIYAFLGCIFLASIDYVITYKIYRAGESYPQVITMKYDLSAIECYSHHEYKIPNSVFAEPEKEKENRQRLCQRLTVKQSDPLFWWSPENREPLFTGGVISPSQYQIIKANWIQAVPAHFYLYLKFRAKVFWYSLLGHTNWYLGPPSTTDYGLQLSIAKPAAYPMLNQIYLSLCGKFQHAIGLVTLILNLTFLTYCLIRAPGHFKTYLLLSGLFYELMWLFLLPVPDSRYFWWFYLATFMAIPIPTRK